MCGHLEQGDARRSYKSDPVNPPTTLCWDANRLLHFERRDIIRDTVITLIPLSQYLLPTKYVYEA